MMFYDFKTITYGKWILAGEHSVIRGGAALVFPIKEKQLTLDYHADTIFKASYSGSTGSEFSPLFMYILDYAIKKLNKKNITGHFHWSGNLPVGQGIGASAALCIAISRWFAAQKWLLESDVYAFAKELEHCFHGKSSGLDITGVSAENGMYFQQGQSVPINPVWQPNWYLSSCGQIGKTKHCVQKVCDLRETNLALSIELDDQMQMSVAQAKAALESSANTALYQLSLAIQLASDCFHKWGLVNTSLQLHMDKLLATGALAVKPTGSGDGGYVVSLWADKLPNTEEFIVI